MNHWPEFIDIGQGTSLGRGDSSLFKWCPLDHVWPRLRAKIYVYISYNSISRTV